MAHAPGGVKVQVFDNPVEAAPEDPQAADAEGRVYQEMKRRAFYEKPSVKRKRKQAQARRKRRRALQCARLGQRVTRRCAADGPW
jgi:small subunit ribosomal protein S21